jgi:DNA-binding CsgD family transcriptional regulator
MPVPDDVACPYCPVGDEKPAAEAPAGREPEPGWLAHLYLCQGLSTYSIAERLGLDRQRVTRMLHRARVPVRPRGSGRLRPVRRSGERPELTRLMRELYQEGRLSSRQIAVILGMPERTVRDRLRQSGIRVRTRGPWNREDRREVPVQVLQDLYVQRGMTAAEAGRLLGMSTDKVLRAAHAHGLPVRSGGAVPLPGPDEIELVSALYADPLIAAVLAAHDVPRVPAGGSLSERFPEPIPLTTPLVKDLYWGCGVSLSHIELLTGQAAESVRGFMRRSGIPLRHPGGRTPFMRRWRSGGTGSAVRLSARRPPRPVHDARRAERAALSGKGDAQ